MMKQWTDRDFLKEIRKEAATVVPGSPSLYTQGVTYYGLGEEGREGLGRPNFKPAGLFLFKNRDPIEELLIRYLGDQAKVSPPDDRRHRAMKCSRSWRAADYKATSLEFFLVCSVRCDRCRARLEHDLMKVAKLGKDDPEFEKLGPDRLEEGEILITSLDTKSRRKIEKALKEGQIEERGRYKPATAGSPPRVLREKEVRKILGDQSKTQEKPESA